MQLVKHIILIFLLVKVTVEAIQSYFVREQNMSSLLSIFTSQMCPKCTLVFLNSTVSREQIGFENTRYVIDFPPQNHSKAPVVLQPRLFGTDKLVLCFVPNDLHIQQFVEHFLNSLSTTLPMQRNTDYFIFITDTVQDAHKILKSPIFRKLMYRLVIAHSNEGIFPVFTSDLFHNRVINLGYLNMIVKDKRIKKEHVFIDFTANLHENSLKVAATNKYFPTFQIEKAQDGLYRDVRGIVSLIHHEIRKNLNTTYEIFVCSGDGSIASGNSGVQLKNGTWVGCMGDIIAERADLSMVVSTSYGRYPHVGWGSPIRFTYITFTTRKPKRFLSWKAIYKSFKPDLWVGIGSAILVYTLLIWNSERMFQKNCRDKVKRLVTTFKYRFRCPTQGVFSIFFNLFKTVVSQSMTNPKANSSKVVFICWLMFTLIVSTAYNSKLTSLLSSPEMQTIPRTLRDLSLSAFELGAPKSFMAGLGQQIFKKSQVKTLRTLYSKMDKKIHTDDYGCLRSSLRPGQSCISWEVSLDFIIGTQFSDGGGSNPFLISSDTLNMIGVSYIAQKHEPILNRVNRLVAYAFESGLLLEMYKMDKMNVRLQRMTKMTRGNVNHATTISTDGVNHHIHGSQPEPLSISKIQGSLLIFCVGICFATCALVLEILIIRVASISLLLFHY